MELVEPQPLGHRSSHFLAVAREHDGAFDAGSVQVANRLLGIGLYGVGNYDMAGVRVIDQYMEDRTDDLAIGGVDTGRSKHLGIADDDALAVDIRRHAMARVIGGVAYAFGIELALEGGAYRLRDGVIGKRLGKGRDLKQ